MAGYQALYRKWRPTVFEDVVGQQHIIETLRNQVDTAKLSHAYLFCGTRGTGKTTTAKILSRAVNCEHPEHGNPCNTCAACKGISDGSIMDVVEIDAASNNGVDNIRDIRDDVNFSASFVKYKVYIIDEVHMLSGSAFNALLKTLEEPPEHVIFILATTDPQKIPATVLSRCQRFDFKRISAVDMVGRMQEIVEKDHLSVEPDALMLIAKAADGALRDALSLLDQCLAFGQGNVTASEAASILGVSDNRVLFRITDAICAEDAEEVLRVVQELSEKGQDYIRFIEALMQHFRNLLFCKSVREPKNFIDEDESIIESYCEQSEKLTAQKLHFAISVLSEAYQEAKWAGSARTLLEVTLLKLTRQTLLPRDEALAQRVAELEEKLASGAFVAAKPSASGKKKPSPKDEAIPEEKKAVPAKVDSVGTEEVNRALGSWAEILSEIAVENQMLAGFITNAEPKGGGKFIALVFGDDYQSVYEVVNQDKTNKELIESVVERISKAKVPVQFVLKKEFDKDEPKRAAFLQELKDDKVLSEIVEVVDA